MKEYTVNTAILFNALTGFDNEEEYVPLEYGGYIQKETDGDKEWFDLKTDNGTPCMNGETCELLKETENYVVLQEKDEQIPFKLSKQEFEIAATLCVMNGRIDWIEMIVNALPNYPNGIIWTDEDEILVKTESAANTIADLIETLYRTQGEEVLVNTGSYDPEEDKRNNEEDRYTGWWYINID